MVTVDASGAFRPIQYLGSKWRLLDLIEQHVAAVRDRARPLACDLFSGTGVVANRLARHGPVIAADVQEYSRVLAAAQLRPAGLTSRDRDRITAAVRAAARDLQSPPLDALIAYEAAMLGGETRDGVERVCDLVERGSIAAWGWPGGPQATGGELGGLLADVAKMLAGGPYAAITEHYGGVYYSYRQASELDSIVRVAHGLPDDVRDTVLAAALGTASELVSSIGGHFAQPPRLRSANGAPKRHAVEGVIRNRQRSAAAVFERWLVRWGSVPAANYAGTAVRGDYREILADLSDDVGVVYADPPYTRDHYSRFYHVLETIALGDQPGLSTVRLGGIETPSRGLYRQDRHQSPFCVVSEAPGAFDQLCRPLAERGIPLVISYSPVPKTDKPRARVMTLDALESRLATHFRRVTTHPVPGIGHAKLNAGRFNASPTYDAEVLLVCTR